MIFKLYAIKDKLTEYQAPIPFKDDKVAIRWFEAICKQKKESEYTDPKYYDLYCIGQYDSEKGEIAPIMPAELVREGENT